MGGGLVSTEEIPLAQEEDFLSSSPWSSFILYKPSFVFSSYYGSCTFGDSNFSKFTPMTINHMDAFEACALWMLLRKSIAQATALMLYEQSISVHGRLWQNKNNRDFQDRNVKSQVLHILIEVSLPENQWHGNSDSDVKTSDPLLGCRLVWTCPVGQTG